MFTAEIPVYVIRNGRRRLEKTITPTKIMPTERRNHRTLADEVLEMGPELSLHPRLALRATDPVKQPLHWNQLRDPSSWKDCSWKRQTARPAQYLRHAH